MVAGTLLVAVTVATVLSDRASENGVPGPSSGPTTDTTATKEIAPADIPPTTTDSADVLSERQMQLLEDPRVIRFSQDLEFQEQVSDFFEQASQMSDEQRAKSAENIENRLKDYQAEGRVSGSEALLLRLALVRTVEQDPQQQEAESRALIQEHQREAEQRMAQWKSRNQPEFDHYKRQEQSIVEEVMAMETIPGGMERNEYLRQRLQKARIEAMGEQQ